ncbi:MAG: hypothetical protein ACKOUR_14445 [Planctomycetota bacterium]
MFGNYSADQSIGIGIRCQRRAIGEQERAAKKLRTDDDQQQVAAMRHRWSQTFGG